MEDWIDNTNIHSLMVVFWLYLEDLHKRFVNLRICWLNLAMVTIDLNWADLYHIGVSPSGGYAAYYNTFKVS